MKRKKVSTTSAAPYRGSFGMAQQTHLLERALFGARLADLKSFENMQLPQALDALLKKSPKPEPPVNHYEYQVADTTNVKLGETWVRAPYGNGTVNFQRGLSLRAWWLLQMQNQQPTLEEKMILFWHNHFATQLSAYNDARYGYKYQDTLREHALGNFKDFVKAITLDSAMLRYLNGDKNSKTAPDENYARELQELFTLGKGPGSNFTEDDVKSAARVLTGLRVDFVNISYYFQDNRHDTDDKQFSEFYNNQVIKGQAGSNGIQEIDQLIDMIFKKAEVSRYIVRKLYIFFFYYDITPEIEQNFIEPVAQVFRENNYEIKPVLRMMFGSEHFFDESLYGAFIKSPIEHVIGTSRKLEAVWPENTIENINEYYNLTTNLIQVAQRGEQLIADPPSVSGWPAYYQAPVFHEIWINSSTFPERTKYTDQLITRGFTRNRKKLEVNLPVLLKKFSNPGDPNVLIKEATDYLLQVPIAAALQKQLKIDILLSGQESDYYWTDLWNAYLSNPNNTNFNMVNSRLSTLFKYLMALPEYQLT